MKRIALLAGIAFTLSTPNWLTAQDQPSAPAPTMQTGPANLNHAEVSVFADYLRFSPATPQINFVGAGGRVGFNVRPNFGLEAEMSYDFSRDYTTTYNTGGTSTFVTTGVRPLTGCLAPSCNSAPRLHSAPSLPARSASLTSAPTIPARLPVQ